MLQGPIRAAERRAEAVSHRLALGLAGLLCALPGAAFLTLAAWLLLVRESGALFAATVIGAVYCGLGLLLWALALSRRARPAPAPQAQDDPYGPFYQMAEGFAVGLEAGRAARTARD